MTHAIDPDALEKMRANARPGTGWYAYENHDMGHPMLGALRFLLCGEGCTISVPPLTCPDTHEVIGWRYVLVGRVDLDAGTIVPLADANGA